MIWAVLLACGRDPIEGVWEGTYQCEDSTRVYFDVEGFVELDDALTGPFWFAGYVWSDDEELDEPFFTANAGTMVFSPRASEDDTYNVALENCLYTVGQLEDYDQDCYTAPPGGAVRDGRSLGWEICWDEDGVLDRCADFTNRCQMDFVR